MAFLTRDDTFAALQRLACAESLHDVLDLLGEQIEALHLADGYLVNMLDAGGNNLVSLKVRFTEKFRNLEQPTIGRHNSLSEDALNSRVYHTRTIQRVNTGNANDHERVVLQYWHASEIIGIPIMHPAHPEDPPIGAIVLLQEKNGSTEAMLAPLQEVVALLYHGLHAWLRHSHLEEMHEQAAAAVAENKRLLQFLNDMNSLTTVDLIYDMFATELFRQLSFDLAAFALVEDQRIVTKKVAIGAPQFEQIAAELLVHMVQTPYPFDPSVSGAVLVFTKDEAMLFPDIENIKHLPMSPHDRQTVDILRTPRTLFLSPIRYQKKPIGIFALYSLQQPVNLSESDQHLLNQLSSFLGTAITNSQTYAISQAQNLEIGHLNEMLQDKVKELAEQASTDRLTGLFNFRSYEREMSKRIKECQRSGGKNEFSLALIDIDYFKRFNDNHGHAAGNDVLAGVAAEIGRVIRSSDTAFRYGGEEFAVTLPKCDLEGAMLLAERIRTAIETSSFITENGTHKVTVSIGCAVFRPDDTQHTLFSRADQALYEAKGQGRNRVCSM